MLLTPESQGLRRMKESEARLFSAWEKLERPYPWNEAQFAETIESRTQTTLVLDGDEQPLAFGVLQIIEGEAYLLNIMVRPERRRQGHGEDILRRLLAWAKDGGATHMFLDVDPMNKPAFNLYEKLGFKIYGRRPRAYPGGESSYLLKKDLS